MANALLFVQCAEQAALEGGRVKEGSLLVSSTDESSAIRTQDLAAKALSSVWLEGGLQPTVAGDNSMNLAALEVKWRWTNVRCSSVASRTSVSNSTELAG